MGNFLSDIYLRSVVFAIFGLVGILLIRRLSASARHAAAAAVLMAMVVLPLVRLLTPERKLAVLPAEVTIVRSFTIDGNASEHAGSKSLPNPPAAPVLYDGIWMFLWALGSALIIVRYLHGYLKVVGWVSRAKPLPMESLNALLLISDEVGVPMTAWIGRQVVIMPPAWDRWDDERRRSAVAHEFAHVKRGDWFTQATCHCVCAVFWPNPLVWVLNRERRMMAERAADDSVLADGVKPAKYAQDLLEIAREATQGTSGAFVGMAQRPDVGRRIELILKNGIRRGNISVGGLFLASTMLTAIVLPVGSFALARRESTAKFRQARKAADQFLAEVTIVAPGNSFESLGLHAPNLGTRSPSVQIKSVTVSAARTVLESIQNTFPEPTAVTVREADLRLLADKLSQKKLVIGNPSVRTLSKQKATITTTVANDSEEKITLIPRLNPDGTVTTSVEFKLQKDKRTDGGVIIYRAKSGETMAIGMSPGGGKPSELRILLKVRIANAETP